MRKRKPSLRLGVAVLKIGIAMITVASANAGQYIQNGRPLPCFPQTCPALGYFAILGLAGFLASLWAVGETILGFLIRDGHLDYGTGRLPPPQAGSGPEDEKNTVHG